MQSFSLWNGDENKPTLIEWYEPEQKRSDSAVVIFPGGGYVNLANHEGAGYAEYLNSIGVTAFVVYYRRFPDLFPLPLLDARRAVRFVRANSRLFGVNEDKILVMGSSAGGHLTALLSTYASPIEGEGVDEIDEKDYLPNGQILCYPVISSDKTIAHLGSYMHLLGEENTEWEKYDPELLVHEKTPKAFIWHTAADGGVRVLNSYRYAAALYKKEIPCEMHIFPYGGHGMGLATRNPHIAQWTGLLKNWLILHDFL